LAVATVAPRAQCTPAALLSFYFYFYSLVVAAILEGLPIVVTVTLIIGIMRMA
jgi:magnesium-transporting ATPase (P-type)